MIGKYVYFKEYPIGDNKINPTRVGKIIEARPGMMNGHKLWVVRPLEELQNPKLSYVSRYLRRTDQLRIIPQNELIIELL